MPEFTPCAVCASHESEYSFGFSGQKVRRCVSCGLLYLDPQPTDAELDQVYSATYFLSPEGSAGQADAAMKAATARTYLNELLAYHEGPRGRLLEVGCGRGEFLVEAVAAGFDVTGVEVSASSCAEANRRLGGTQVRQGLLEDQAFDEGGFDVCVLFDVIEHVRDPLTFLTKVRALLRSGGTLFVVTPNVDGRLARWMGQRWMEFKVEHLFYFNPLNLQNAVAKSGFESVEVESGRKVLNVDYLNRHFQRFPVAGFSALVSLFSRLLPARLRHKNLSLPTGGLRLMARPAELRAVPLLSVVVPVYNEATTFPALVEALLAKQIAGLEKEIIIVESGSTDGTREQVQALEGRPGVRIFYEEKPRGKGHAVRQGLQAVRGDWVLIQDGDMEYDIDDYDNLLAPLMAYQTAFVLGSRHQGDWKMREYADQRLAALLLNSGHLLFTFLLNLACGSRLKDPFTMFKVFRRDCLHGLEFKANRFDFDFELMIKLLRKGYRPIEIPVNYRSRSFKEGKKIRVFYDPMTWIWALIRFRFSPLHKP